MKILVVSNMYPSNEDPAFGVFVKNFFDYLCLKNGTNNTQLSAIKGKGQTKISKLWKYVVFYLKTTLLILFRKYDLVYVHTVTYPIIPLKIASTFKDIPLAFNIHGSDWITHSARSAKLKRMALPLVQKAKLIVVPSTIFKKLVIDEMPQYNVNKIKVSYSGGIDISQFRPLGIRKRDRNSIVIGYVSRIIENKGWRLFVEAVSVLKEQNISVKGLMAGGGEQEPKLLEMISSKGLCNDIEYLGSISQQELPEIYNRLDLFIFPTLFYESLGLVGLEAMACGVPVIGTNQGGLKEYIKHGVNGFLFERNDVTDLCCQILNYISMDVDAKKIMENNAVNTTILFSRENVMDGLIQEIYKIKTKSDSGDKS